MTMLPTQFNRAGKYWCHVIIYLLLSYVSCADASTVCEEGSSTSDSTDYLVVCTPEKLILPHDNARVSLRVTTLNNDGTPLIGSFNYNWSVSHGEVSKQKSNTQWLLGDVEPGKRYCATATVSNEQTVSRCTLHIFIASVTLDTHPEDNVRGTQESRWTLLSRADKEDKGYGLYSYLIFRKPPTTEDRQRYLDIIVAYMRMNRLTAYMKNEFSPSELNVIYIPVEKDAPDDIKQKELASWVLDNYDYDKASILFKQLAGKYHDGPYIVSSTEALGLADQAKIHLMQNLSNAPGELASSWMELFAKQVSQEQFWNVSTISRLALKIRGELIQIGTGGVTVLNTIGELKELYYN